MEVLGRPQSWIWHFIVNLGLKVEKRIKDFTQSSQSTDLEELNHQVSKTVSLLYGINN